MNYENKIRSLKTYLYRESTNYRDTFKNDIIYYLNDDFNPKNPLLLFLNELNNENEIISFIDSLNSSIVLKFDDEHEQISDFIHEYFIQIK